MLFVTFCDHNPMPSPSSSHLPKFSPTSHTSNNSPSLHDTLGESPRDRIPQPQIATRRLKTTTQQKSSAGRTPSSAAAKSRMKPTPYASQAQKIKRRNLNSSSGASRATNNSLNKVLSNERKQRKERQLDREISNEVAYFLNPEDRFQEEETTRYHMPGKQQFSGHLPTEEELAEYSQGYSLHQETESDLPPPHHNEPFIDAEDQLSNDFSNPEASTTESTNQRIEYLNQQLREEEELHMSPDMRAKLLEKEQFKIRLPGLPLVENRTERLALIKLAHGPVHVEVVRALLDLAQTYILTDAVDSAIPHLEKALKLCYALLQKDPSAYSDECESLTSLIMLTLAVAHIKNGQIERAEALVLKAQKLNEDVHEDEDDQSNFAIHMILGQVYASMDKIEAAEASFTAAWEIKEQLDPDHPLLGTVYTELGRLYRDVGRLKQSTEMLERACEVAETNRGKHDMDVAHLSFLLCDLFSELGEFDRALEAGKKAHDIVQKYAVNYDHLYLKEFTTWKFHVQVAHACSLIHNQQYKEAAPLLHEVIEADESLYSDGSSEGTFLTNIQKAFCLKMLGSVWAVLGAWNEAHGCFLQSCHLYAKVRGVNDSETQRLVHRLARIRIEMSQNGGNQ